MRDQLRKGAALVALHEARIANRVQGYYRGQFTPLSRQCGRPLAVVASCPCAVE
jgi:hypothetical protein